MAVSKLLKSFISKTNLQKARTLFNKHKNGKLTAREVEQQLNSLGLKANSPYGESKSIGQYRVAPKAQSNNTEEGTIIIDLKPKNKAR